MTIGARPSLWSGLEQYFPYKNPVFEEIQTRLLYRQVLEAIKRWDSGVLRLDRRPTWVPGVVFPRLFRGVLSFIDYVGEKISSTLRAPSKYGERFAVPSKVFNFEHDSFVGVSTTASTPLVLTRPTIQIS